jgi:hypothetical protein
MNFYTRTRPASNPIRPRVARRDALRSLASAPAATVHPFAVGLDRPAVAARVRAPRGGVDIAGRFYRGGSYLPANAPAIVATAPVATNPRDSWPAWTDEERWTIAEPPASEIDLTAFAVPREPEPARFAIHGFTYTAREVPAGECGSVAFAVHRPDTNHTYHVIRDNFDVVKCDCPDFLMRHDGTGRMCKHGSKLVELGLIPAPTPVASTLGHREFITPYVSILCHGPAPRARKFEPTPEDNAEAAELFANLADACY